MALLLQQWIFLLGLALGLAAGVGLAADGDATPVADAEADSSMFVLNVVLFTSLVCVASLGCLAGDRERLAAALNDAGAARDAFGRDALGLFTRRTATARDADPRKFLRWVAVL
ncbi:hypothetical protein M885DRAFT_558469 [Pelagophyceae sp. CCMP2097]|nr:hypothetical protein M885DRAFT_558469 [Pelagophyceae sp. CCMP2097]